MHAKTRGDRQAAGQLARAKHGFERWRQSPKRSRRIPERLWRMAAKAASIHGLYAAAREPRLNATRLKEQIRCLSQDRTSELREQVRSLGQDRDAEFKQQQRSLSQDRTSELREQVRSLGQDRDAELKQQQRSLSQDRTSELREQIRSLGQDRDAEFKEQQRSLGQDRDLEKTPGFVEFPWLGSTRVSECILEAEGREGGKLRIHLKGEAVSQAVSLGQMLWKG